MTDQPMDGESGCRVACMRLKTINKTIVITISLYYDVLRFTINGFTINRFTIKREG